MQRLFPTLLLLAAACRLSPVPPSPEPVVSRIEHFYLESARADSLFRFFRDEVGLPVVWDYQSFGEFASGGLTLGNVAMEFVYAATVDPGARFTGIAFEPVADADSAIAVLDARGHAHGDPVETRIPYRGEEVVGWVTVGLGGLRPQDANVFICDYKLREAVAESRLQASEALAAAGGGPLGVLEMREIVLGVTSAADAVPDWAVVLGAPSDGSAFVMARGPGVRLVDAAEDAVRGIVIRVSSLERARAEMQARGWLADGRDTRFAPSVVGDLDIRLAE